MLPPESHDSANLELNDDSIRLAAAEPGPEVVAPVLETSESQAQHFAKETTEVSFTHSFSRIS